MENAKLCLKMADKYPYDGTNDGDWTYRAARGVLADLSDRRGVKNELEAIDDDLKRQIVIYAAGIIRAAFEAEEANESKQ